MQVIIDIPRSFYEHCKAQEDAVEILLAIKNGIPIQKGHGRLVDIGKIDKDRIDNDNPIIYLTINGEYIEAVSLDYINNLPAIIEADEEYEKEE